MTHAAAERVAGEPGSSFGWREAITPLSRASRRRWLVVYVLLLVVTGALTGWSDALGTPQVDYAPPLVAVVALFVVFGMLRRGIRQIAAFDRPALDERDQQQFVSAFRYAYPLLLAVAAASLAVLVLTLPETESQTYAIGATDVAGRRFLLSGEVLAGLALWGLLWAVFLPTAVLAWREPDPILPDDRGDAMGGESIRDLLLAVGLAVSVYIGVTSDSSLYGLLALAAAVALVAGGRRQQFGRLGDR
jgi:hypothetical protein